jgi:hypothetical protein
MSTLREAISEISKVNIRISELLAVHQVKIDQQAQKEEDINRKVETGISNLTVKMESDKVSIYEKMDTDKSEVLSEIKGLRDKVFIGMGMAIIVNIILVTFGPQFVESQSGGLTKLQSYVRLEPRSGM